MVVKLSSARKVLVAALALYLLWVAALATLAVVSGSRPSAAKIGSATDLTPPAQDSEQPND
jgi:hypothetical protein